MTSSAGYSQSDYKALKKESCMDFDLFKLDFHKTMKKVFYFKGKNSKKLFDKLVEDWCENKEADKTDLVKELQKRYNCEISTIQKFVYSKDYFPVYLVKNLILDLPKDMHEYYFKEFNRCSSQIKFGTSKSWITFPKKLSAKLSWLCGAIAADGWISSDKDYKERLGIVDQNERTVLRAKKFFQETFDFSPKVFKDKNKDCFLLIVDSKTISKFFTIFMGCSYGFKAYTVSEPAIIRQSRFRLDFASGVLCFDGSVGLSGIVSLGSKSKTLVKDVYGILNQNELPVKYSKHSNGTYFATSASLLNAENISEWIKLFDEKLEKGYRLKCLAFGFKETVKTENDALVRIRKFIKYPRRRECPFEKIFQLIKNDKKILKEDLLIKSGVAHATLYSYTWLLRQANIVTCDTGYFGRGYKNEYIFNPNVSEWRLPMVC